MISGCIAEGLPIDVVVLYAHPTKFVKAAAQVPWEAAGCIGPQRLQPFVPELADRLTQCGELTLAPEVDKLLRQASAATRGRLLAPARATLPPRSAPTTRPGTWLKGQIPIRTFAEWDDAGPGFLEVDLVAHCGPSTEGFSLCTLCAVDVATSWVELDAVWGKGQQRVGAAVHDVRQRLPTALLGLDSDNGSESHQPGPLCVLPARGHHLHPESRLQEERQRPCGAEERAIVRALIGYDRYATKAAYAQLACVYRLVRLHVNFFQPVQKLLTKTRASARVHRLYDRAQTPYQRLCATGLLTPAKRQELDALYHGLNPLQLRRQIDRELERLWALVSRPRSAPRRRCPAVRNAGEAAMTSRGPIRHRVFAPGSILWGRAISQDPPKSPPAPASHGSHPAPLARRLQVLRVTLTFDLQLSGG